MSSTGKRAELDAERRHVADLYSTLDAERCAAAARLQGGTAGTDANGHTEREAAVAHWHRRLAQLRAAERGLCFGRLDRDTGQRTYVGRVGLFDDACEEPLLTDWRAPAARPFYCATAAEPRGVARRRHFRTSGRELLDFHDDLVASTESAAAVGDSALIAALEAPRGGSMGDIVATIQAEQDEIIRLEHSGVLVVEGGPGTGKTAVALHRVAFLLYEHRERLSRRGVLVVGPNSGFLDHIGAVLPSLGENDVVFAAPGQLFPGVTARNEDSPERTRIKGDLSMVDALRRAVADRQELPGTPVEIPLDDVTLHVDDAVTAEARRRARATGLAHNPARRVFREHLGALLVQQALDRIGRGWLDPDDPPEIQEDIAGEVRDELRRHADFHDALERLWPELTPQRLLADLLSSRDRLEAAGDDSLLALHRDEGDAWTVPDAALLDEATELLGRDTTDQDRHTREQQRSGREYAEGVLEILDSHDDPDGESVRAGDVVDAAQLAERQEEDDHRPLAERAAADRTWGYGHLVVDEAQELSPMSWRVLMRRCPGRSATLVGDLAQRRSPGGVGDWSSTLAPHVGDRWAHRRLSVNYRTPAEIMDVASGVQREFAAAAEPPISARRGDKPWRLELAGGPAELDRAVRESVLREPVEQERSIAVIAAPSTLAVLDVPDRARALVPAEAKGLEFDVVIVVSPEEIHAGGERGPADLYVALTRATHRLGVVHAGELPDCLRENALWSFEPPDRQSECDPYPARRQA